MKMNNIVLALPDSIKKYLLVFLGVLICFYLNAAQRMPLGKYIIEWTDMVNVDYNSQTMELSNSGSSGWGSSGAASLNSIASKTNGAYEHSITSYTRAMLGLSNSNTNANYNTIDYAFYLNSNKRLYIYENGVYKKYLGRYYVGDKIQIERIGSTIYYKFKNAVVRTVSCNAIDPLIADIAFYGNSKIGPVFMSQGVDHSIFWTDMVNVNYNPSTMVLSNSGSGGWGSSGAASENYINPNEDGYYTHTITTSSTRVMLGLSYTNVNANFNTINFCFYLNTQRNLDIYENGIRKISLGRYNVGDKIQIERIGNKIYYKFKNALVRSVVCNVNNQLVTDVSFYGSQSIGPVYMSRGVEPMKSVYHPVKSDLDGGVYIVKNGKLRVKFTDKYGVNTSFTFKIYSQSPNNYELTDGDFSGLNKILGDNRIELDLSSSITDTKVYVFEIIGDKGKKQYLKFRLDAASQ
jgi:hypothetical protein